MEDICISADIFEMRKTKNNKDIPNIKYFFTIFIKLEDNLYI
jgi:hypothetical protein